MGWTHNCMACFLCLQWQYRGPLSHRLALLVASTLRLNPSSLWTSNLCHSCMHIFFRTFATTCKIFEAMLKLAKTTYISGCSSQGEAQQKPNVGHTFCHCACILSCTQMAPASSPKLLVGILHLISPIHDKNTVNT